MYLWLEMQIPIFNSPPQLAPTHSRHQSQSWREEYATANTREEALSEHELPVFGADAHEEDSENLQHGADKKGGDEKASVQQTAGEDSAHHGQPNLHGADPGDGRGRRVWHGGLVVSLEAAKRVEVAPCDKNSQPVQSGI